MKRRISIATLVFLILFSAVFPVKAATNEGYGEDQTSLGQVVDSFENSGNISVTVEVIRNSTKEAIELNQSASVPQYENFTTYSERDINNRLSRFLRNVTFTNYERDDDGDIRFDYGSGNLLNDGAQWTFKFQVTALDAGDIDTRNIMHVFVVSQGYAAGARDNNEIQFAIRQRTNDDTVYGHQWVIYDGGPATQNNLGVTDFNVSQEYYVLINRTGNNKGLFIFYDSACTNLVEGLTITVGTDIYRYNIITRVTPNANDGSDWASGYVKDLLNGSKAGGMGYVSEGYFTTADYLADPLVSGAGLAVLVNTTIPTNTGIKLQISNDNITWRDHAGVIGNSEGLTGGFEAVDIRDLNYSGNIFFRGNLSTSDLTVTPLFNQIRLITMIGNVSAPIIQNVTGAWIEYNASAINASVGTVDAGNLSSTYFIDGDTFDVSEVVGVPGMGISVNFSGVDPLASCLWLNTYYSYDGNLNHDFDIEIWNFDTSSWVEDSHLVDTVGFEWANATIYALRIPLEYISGGEVRVRFDHEAAGNINHDLFIDYVRLQAFVPSAAATEEAFEFFWIVIGIALMLIGIIISKMWFDQENS